VLSERYDNSLNQLFQTKLNEEAGYTKTNLLYHYANYLTHGDSAIVTQGIQYLYEKGLKMYRKNIILLHKNRLNVFAIISKNVAMLLFMKPLRLWQTI
jgi:hypothetical protein